MFAAFATAAAVGRDVVGPGEGGPGGGDVNANENANAKVMLIECGGGTAVAAMRLLVRLIQCPCWGAVRAHAREVVVRELLASVKLVIPPGVDGGEIPFDSRARPTDEDCAEYFGLLDALRDPAISGVPLSRPLGLRVDAALAEVKEALLPYLSASSTARGSAAGRSRPLQTATVTPPAKKRRRVMTTPRTGTNVEMRLRAVADMEAGPESCHHVSRLCVSILRGKSPGDAALLSALAIDTGTTLLMELMGTGSRSIEAGVQRSDVQMVLMSALDLAASLLEVAAISQTRFTRRCDLDASTATATATITATGTAATHAAGISKDASIAASKSNGAASDPAGASMSSAALSAEATAFVRVALAAVGIFRVIPSFLSRQAGEGPRAGEGSEVLIPRIVVRASMLLWRLSDLHLAFSEAEATGILALGGESGLPGLASELVQVATAFEACAVDGRVSASSARCCLLRSAARVLSRDSSAGSVDAAEASIDRVQEVVRSNFSSGPPELVSGALYALADLLCCSVSCYQCGLQEGHHSGSLAVNLQSCRSGVWTPCFKLVEPIVRGSGHPSVIAAGVRVLHRLVVHAPVKRIGTAGAELVQSLWHPTSTTAQMESASCLSKVLVLAAQQKRLGEHPKEREAAGECESVSLSRKQVAGLREDSWDGPERAFQMGGPGGLNCIAPLLGTELREQLQRVSQQGIDYLPISMLSQLSGVGGGAAAHVVSIARQALIEGAVSEQLRTRHLFQLANAKAQTAPTFCAWTELVVVMSKSEHWTSGQMTGADPVSLLNRKLLPATPDRIATWISQLASQTVSDGLARFLLSRYKEWLPLALERLLKDDAFAFRLISVLHEVDAQSFWEKVPRFSLGAVLRNGNREILESLSLRVEKPPRELVDRVCADSLSRTALLSPESLTANGDKSVQLIEEIMDIPLTEIVESRVGKIIQRVVMEFGEGRDDCVKNALKAVARVIRTKHGTGRDKFAEELVAENFLLVMDAVNRGLFGLWVSTSERLRCLRILNAVLRLCRKSLNLFVPKVMATLKMALQIDGTDRAFRGEVCLVWVTFMEALGPSRLGPHLGSVLSILAPHLTHHHRVIGPALCAVFVDGRAEVASYFQDIALLITTIAHPALAPAAQVVRDEVALGTVATLQDDADDEADEEFAARYVKNVSEVLDIASSHDSPAIRCLALDRLLDALRRRRGWLLSGFSNSEDEHLARGKRETLSRLLHGFTCLLLHPDVGIRDRAMKCLGEIGAVDPVLLSSAHIPNSSSPSPKSRPLPTSVLGLAGSLLTDFLVPALLRGDRLAAGNKLNRLGLAVQELLRVCKCDKGTPQRASSNSEAIRYILGEHPDESWEAAVSAVDPALLHIHFWGRLSIEVQETVLPYLSRPFDTSAYNVGTVPQESSSAYSFAVAAEQTLIARGAVWLRLAAAAEGGGGPGLVAEWRMQMTAQLTDFIGDRGRFGSLLKALRPVLRYEDAISSHLLPLAIMETIDCVREAGCSAPATRKQSIVSAVGTLGKDELDVVGGSPVFAFILSELTIALKAGGEAAQSVFIILDTLRFWRDSRAKVSAKRNVQMERSTLANSVAVSGMSRRRARTEIDFIDKATCADVLTLLVDMDGNSKLSLMLMAHAARNGRAYSRSLMYAEQHIRNLRRAANIASWPAFIKELIGGPRHGQSRHGVGADVNTAEETVDVGAKPATTASTATRVALQRNPAAEAEALSLMQVCLAELEDADGMEGVAALRRETNLSESILDAEASARFDSALLGYEQALAESPQDPHLHSGFLRCLRTLGHWETMLAHAEGITHTHGASISDAKGSLSLKQAAQALGMEAAWRLGRWDRVDDILRDSTSTSLNARELDIQRPVRDGQGLGEWEAVYGKAVGQMLACVRRKEPQSIKDIACRARSSLLGPATDAAMEGYARAYPLIVKLHSLADIEDAVHAVSCHVNQDEVTGKAIADLAEMAAGDEEQHAASQASVLNRRLFGMNERSDSTASSLHVREPILSCRRVLLELLDLPSEASAISLELAKLAREGGNLRAASAAAHRAMSSVAHESDEWFAASTEMAQIQAARGDKTGALLVLEKLIDRMDGNLRAAENDGGLDDSSRLSSQHRRLADLHLLAGVWIEEARSAPQEDIVKHYKLAKKLAPDLAGPLYALGRFYDDLIQAGGTNIRTMSMSDARISLLPSVLESYTGALLVGHDRLFEILPRLLTIWFDFYSNVSSTGQSLLAAKSTVNKARAFSGQMLDRIPCYMWMTVVPQLMSRVLHPNEFVRKELVSLLAKIVATFPTESMWMIAPASQLKQSNQRRDACSVVLNTAIKRIQAASGGRVSAENKAGSTKLKKQIRGALLVLKDLIGVCTTVVPKDKRGRAIDCAKEFTSMRDYVQKTDLVVPTLAALTVSLPSRKGRKHSPFAREPVTIVDVETIVLVMSSLMRPRRIGFIASDGGTYRFLAKRETSGDMRKDSRLVDFLTVVNRLLAKNRAAQRRDLNLKTYAVLPLTEETGLIEWVNDVSPFRSIVREEQQRLGPLPDSSTVLANHKSLGLRKFFEEWAVPGHAAALDRFFLRKFGSDPRAWLASRNLWTKSVATWSMTGYIVGLGDRHGENLLIETTTGRCIHVDFAMLFDKGKSLKVPEVVPFRLTHNMVVAMGVCGYEGTFRVVSEIVMGVLRGNSVALMGVLESFLHDPLADWTSKVGGQHPAGQQDAYEHAEVDIGDGDEGNNEHAADMRRAVDAKLKGLFGSSELPLSIKGQVHRLIHEATSAANLSEMYIWWGAWNG